MQAATAASQAAATTTTRRARSRRRLPEAARCTRAWWRTLPWSLLMPPRDHSVPSCRPFRALQSDRLMEWVRQTSHTVRTEGMPAGAGADAHSWPFACTAQCMAPALERLVPPCAPRCRFRALMAWKARHRSTAAATCLRRRQMRAARRGCRRRQSPACQATTPHPRHQAVRGHTFLLCMHVWLRARARAQPARPACCVLLPRRRWRHAAGR